LLQLWKCVLADSQPPRRRSANKLEQHWGIDQTHIVFFLAKFCGGEGIIGGEF